MSIVQLILITFISIVIISSLVIGNIIFTNWFDYADRALNEISDRLDKDAVNVVEFYMENHWSGIKHEDQKSLSNHLELIVKDQSSIAVLIDKNTEN